MDAKSAILSQQVAWAKRRGIRLQKGNPKSRGDAYYTTSLGDNLFEPLCREAEIEYEQGDGTPLKSKNGSLPHLWALHNSDAIAVNVFHYWKTRSPATVARYLGIPEKGIESIHFEQKFQILPSGTKPNIDVAIRYCPNSELAWVGIESKMVETYPAVPRKLFDDKYFVVPAQWWTGLDATRRLAESFRGDGKKTETERHHLDRGQLIKHVLGLRSACRESNTDLCKVMLIYLWFDVDSSEAREHEKELAALADVLARDGVQFRAITWQELIGAMSESEREKHTEYVAYLCERYVGVF